MSARAPAAAVLAVAALSALVPAIAAAPEADARPTGHGYRSGPGPVPPLAHAGRWLTDARGRVVVLHGVNMVYKRPPYAPDATGFGADDADFLRRYGFNTVRLGTIYAGVEPSPGSYSRRYLRRVARTERILARERIFTQIDFHQDLYNERFQGEGWPDWAVQDDGLPAEPKLGFPYNYFGMPALMRAFDNFWANSVGPGGTGLVDRYAAAWRRVAAHFRRRPFLMGYDLMNEPWPGSTWLSCANPEGCPVFDRGVFADFYRRTIAAIRRADRRNLIWYEPNVTFNSGADTQLPYLGDRRLGFSFHVYCLTGALGGGDEATSCPTLEELVFDNADAHADETGSALLMSEFGATDRTSVNRRNVESADAHMISWQYWHYCACEDPTTAGPGAIQALVVDPSRPPRGRNVDRSKLRVLVRPYPHALAGTPLRYGFEPRSRRFELVYSKRRASGRGRFRRGISDVFIPKLHYRRGYRVRVRGAEVVRARGQHLVLRGRPAARTVRVVVTPRRRATP